jgi:glycosyltransferase involved in cell wall biosynthesis
MVWETNSWHCVLRYKVIYEKIARRARAIVTDSDTVREDIIHRWQLDTSRVVTTGIGISQEFVRYASATLKRLPVLPTLLYVGSVDKKKNSAWLVHTVTQGIRTGALPRLKLILAGSRGYGFTEVESELHMAQGIVEWKCGLSTEEIVQLYCSCTAVVLPSLREGFGLPLLEAMYCDKPIIASRIPTSIEVTNGGAHFFTLNDEEEFYQAVRDALDDKNAAERRRIAEEQLEKYSWKNCVKTLVKVYKDVVSDGA